MTTKDTRRFKCGGCKKWLGVKKFYGAPPSQLFHTSRPVSYRCVRCRHAIDSISRANNSDVFNARRRERYAADVVGRRALARARRAANPELFRERARVYCAANAVKIRARKRMHYAENAAEINARIRMRRINDADHVHLRDTAYRAAMRVNALLKLGGRCVVCGESELVFLTCAHINDNGSVDRAAGIKQAILWMQILNDKRADIEVRCWNHNDGDYRNKIRDKSVTVWKHARRQEFRHAAFIHLGGKCSCCGNEAFENFTMHHTNNDGNKDREIGVGSEKLTRLVAAGLRTDIVAHCPNCQFGASRIGGCPHKWTKRQKTNAVRARAKALCEMQ